MRHCVWTAVMAAAGVFCAGPALAVSTFTVDFDSPGNVSCFVVPIPCSNGNTVQGVSAELPTGLQFVSLAGRFWGTGYSGATNVLTTFVPKADLWVAFQAAPGYRVRVEEFTLAPRQGGVQASQPFRANGVLGWTGDLSTATTFAAAAGGAERSNTFTLQSTYNRADIAIDSITVSVTAVPEPGSWALMAAGLALLGGQQALRRRRAESAARRA